MKKIQLNVAKSLMLIQLFAKGIKFVTKKKKKNPKESLIFIVGEIWVEILRLNEIIIGVSWKTLKSM